MKSITLRSTVARQRGVASLIVVLALFFIVSMVAAYTNRNLIFEQRTGSNQYRSTQAMEAAQAGLEWAKAMLNTGRITSACLPSTLSSDTTFRERYLNIDSDGFVTARTITPPPPGLFINYQLMPTCVYNGSSWDCDCPANAAASVTATASSNTLPAFKVRFLAGAQAGSPVRPGMLRIEAVGCTRLDTTCLDFLGQGEGVEGRAMATELVTLVSGLPSPPLAALTAGGNVNLGGAAMALYNPDRDAGGFTIQSRGTVNTAGLVLSSLPGTPGSASVIENDTASLIGPADRLFAGFFNMWPATYRLQPATVVLNAATDPANCVVSGCNAAAVRNALLLNPGRVIWIDGNLTVDSAGDIATAAAPALLVVAGDLTFTNNVNIYGLVYTRTATWTTSGSGVVRGAVVAEGAVAGSGTPTLMYDAAVLKRLRLANGSMVKVPGGWKDFCSTPNGAIAGNAGTTLGFQC